MRFRTRAAAAVAVTAILAAGGCSRAATSSTSSGTSTAPSASAAAAGQGPASGSASGGGFGTLPDVCHGGSASGSTDQGVTSSSIKVGVLTDVGFTKDPQLENAAKVFTSWCNAQGGINGRKLVPDIHDTQMLQVVGAMSSACASDFVLAGGSAALDGLAVSTRLKCMLPDFDAQTVMPQNAGAALQIDPATYNFSYSDYGGYYKFLYGKYPGSQNAVGVLAGQSAIDQPIVGMTMQSMQGVGGKVIYNGTFPVTGVSNWTPYAEALKTHGVKGMTFDGTPEELAALEQSLDSIGYHLDWIDANSNAYGTGFLQIAGQALAQQHNYADLFGVYPVEKAASSPAASKIVALFKQYAPGQPVTLQVEQAFSVWLEFAVSAETCGANLTRKCVYNAGVKQTAWTGGGITAPVNESNLQAAPSCYDIEQATSSGWQPAQGWTPNTDGVFGCNQPVVKLSNLGQPLQLAAVGKSLSDLK